NRHRSGFHEPRWDSSNCSASCRFRNRHLMSGRFKTFTIQSANAPRPIPTNGTTQEPVVHGPTDVGALHLPLENRYKGENTTMQHAAKRYTHDQNRANRRQPFLQRSRPQPVHTNKIGKTTSV